MLTLERIPAALAQVHRRNPEAATFRTDDTAMAQHVRITDSGFFRPMQLLPLSRRKALHALFAFCREIHGVSNGDTSRMVKLALLAN
jgi:phytoene/squalene synthetase